MYHLAVQSVCENACGIYVFIYLSTRTRKRKICIVCPKHSSKLGPFWRFSSKQIAEDRWQCRKLVEVNFSIVTTLISFGRPEESAAVLTLSRHCTNIVQWHVCFDKVFKPTTTTVSAYLIM